MLLFNLIISSISIIYETPSFDVSIYLLADIANIIPYAEYKLRNFV